ncbi:DUF3987 domain-containing protein [Streptomyces erythrochromogenes]|uniref:DUF3987 domain-containing protein n=1 Tax=Streptomyces erythrochromogenes TaxID=285574 RepID=UPI00380AE600
MTAYDRVIDALNQHGCRGRGRAWQCPAHEDRSPSLSVTRSAKGVVLHCHAGCAPEDVTSALQLTMPDLFDEPAQRAAKPVVVAEYSYVDEHGELLMTVKRLEPGYDGQRKTFRQYAPDGKASVRGIRRVLYRLPEVLAAAQAGGPVFVVEGEKDADNLAATGATATCNVGGAGKWSDDYVHAFKGASEVIIIRDRDEPGAKHAAAVAESVRRAGIPVRVLEPAKGKDVSDHLAAGLAYADLRDPAADVAEEPPYGADLDAWDEPLPLAAPPPLPLDVHRLGGIGAYANAVAGSLQMPVDIPAFLGLAAASVAVGGRRTVSPKPDWVEPVTLYVMPVAAPGEKKSPALGHMARPIYDEQARRRAEDRVAVARDQQERRIAEACVANAEAMVIKAATPDKRMAARANLDSARMDLENLGEPKILTQLIADDTTPEAATSLLAEQGERLGVLSTEGSFLGNVGGRYSKEANPEIALKGWSQEPHTVNRKNAPPLFVERPNFSLGLAVQPGLLTGMGETGDVFEARGLMGRFVYAMPASRVGDRTYDTTPIPEALRASYHAAITRMMTTVWDDCETREMNLDPDAQAAFRAFWEALEARYKNAGDLASIEGWANKLPGQVLRIAAVLTLFESPDALTVPGRVMVDVIALVPYMIGHAKLVADLMSAERQSTLGPARAVLAWLRKTHPEAPVSAAEVHRGVNGQKWCTSTSDVDQALTLLERFAWIRWAPTPEPTGGRGRPPKPRFEVHPRVLEQPR